VVECQRDAENKSAKLDDLFSGSGCVSMGWVPGMQGGGSAGVPGMQGGGVRDTDYFGVWNTDYFDYICAII
jgi:hypothetical protein